MELNLRVNTKAKAEESTRNKEDEILEPLSPQSQVFFTEDLSYHVLAVFESETFIDFTALHDFLKNDFIPTSTRFSSIPIEDKKGKKMWKRVEVKVEDHIIIPNFPQDLSPEIYTQHFDDYMSKIAKDKLSQDKPLWECHVIKYPISHTINGTSIFKFHHAIADGISLMGCLFSCLRRADDKSLPLTFPSSKSNDQKPNGGNFTKICCFVPKCMSCIFSALCHFGQGIGRLMLKDDFTPIKSGNTNALNSFRYCTITFSLSEVKRIKKNLGVTVNDVVLGTIFLGTQLYMQEMNPKLRKARTRALVSVNARSTKGYAHSKEMHKEKAKVPWGNKFTVILIPLQKFDQEDVPNPLNVVMNAHKIMKTKRNSFGLYLLAKLGRAIGTYGGVKVAARMQSGLVKKASLGISNMIGPIEQMSLANHLINGFYFVVTGMKMSLTVSVMSYMNDLRIGIGVETDLVNQTRLVKCVENAFDLIRVAATTPPP